jgi:hypothetical protein
MPTTQNGPDRPKQVAPGGKLATRAPIVCYEMSANQIGHQELRKSVSGTQDLMFLEKEEAGNLPPAKAPPASPSSPPPP